jgi:hypothetical protein
MPGNVCWLRLFVLGIAAVVVVEEFVVHVVALANATHKSEPSARTVARRRLWVTLRIAAAISSTVAPLGDSSIIIQSRRHGDPIAGDVASLLLRN